MGRLKQFFVGALLGTALLTGCQNVAETYAPVTLSWEVKKLEGEKTAYENTFVMKNVSQESIPANWAVYFMQFPRETEVTEGTPVTIGMVNANYFKMAPTEACPSLAPGESMKITYRTVRTVKRNSDAPEGIYWVAADGNPLPIKTTIAPIESPETLAAYPQATEIYDANLRFAKQPQLATADILPSVKKMQPLENVVVLGENISLTCAENFANEGNILQDKLATLYGIHVSEDAPVKVVIEQIEADGKQCPEEFYALRAADQQITIRATTAHGAFNGVQTLLALIKGKEKPYELEAVEIEDYPDFPYRAVMMDVARNFTTPENMKHLVDVMASYKMNVLHFHFSDDEAWRLEIPGLEELTEVGAFRKHTTDESKNLYPSYSGCYDPTAPDLANGYYSREEFIDLLSYAAQRHVRIIPEIESPGHARAAVVSMKVRYNKYKDTDMAKATQYLLSEEADTSKYISVQSYKDNVMNVALPSTQHFMQKVILEMNEMYKEAGLEMGTVHMGGDEVPRGVWVGSPACQQLMKEKGMTKVHDLFEYHFTEIANFMQQHGLKISGWQEIATRHSEAGHNQLRSQMENVNCWSMPEDWGGASLIEQVPNTGYPMIMSNVSNFYLDLAYNGHPDERGLDWGGYVDEAKTFSTLPYSFPRSGYINKLGKPVVVEDVMRGKPAYNEVGLKNVIGLSGQLFSETIRSYEWVQYYIFPKMMGLVERAWNARPVWESLASDKDIQAYNEDLNRYYEKISAKEMPHWAQTGVNFRLPQPGIKLENGKLYANSAIRGAEIRYTTDGSEPTAQSALWEAPVACNAEIVKAKIFYQGKEGYTIIYRP